MLEKVANQDVHTNNVEQNNTAVETVTAVEVTDTELKDQQDNLNINSGTELVTEIPNQINIEQKTEETVAKTEQLNSKTNRELKLLLELSKEANLDTNIAYKRKSVEAMKLMEKQDSRVSTISNSETRDSTGKRSMRSQNPDFLAKHHKFLSKLSVDPDIQENVSENDDKFKDGTKPLKKKKEKFNEATVGGAIDEKSRKLLQPAMAMIKNNKDGFCWRCHRENVNVSCGTCPRSYHSRCLKQSTTNAEHWACPECVSVLKAENTKTRSPAMKDMGLEHFCGLLKFALKRMMQCSDSEHFIHPVDEKEFPDYRNYIIQPMDFTKIEKNIKENLYGSTCAFEADAKWMLHNSIIFNSYQSKLTSIAKAIIKVCKQEMAEIENCANCYLNANTKKDWFVEVCPKPHILLWAKLKGFPYWPAKAMSTNSQGMVDARFFGAHDKAWIHFKECFLYSNKDPNSNKQKRNDINECVKELEIHIENLKAVHGEFCYAPYRTPFEPEKEMEQLKILLPKYNTNKLNSPIESKSIEHISEETKSGNDTKAERDYLYTTKTPRKGRLKCRSDSEKSYESNKDMEGYGTDDELDINLYEKNNKYLKVDNDDTRCETQIESSVAEVNAKMSPSTVADKRVTSNIKRCSTDSINETPKKLYRKNSDTSDSSRLSSISEKINKADTKENVEINLGTEQGNIKMSDKNFKLSNLNNRETSTEIKKEVIVANKEFTISPQNKCKISDHLIKKLTDNNTDTSDLGKLRVQISCPENDDVVTESQPTIVDINQVILGDTSNLNTVEILKVNPNTECDSMDVISSDNEVLKLSGSDKLTNNSNESELADGEIEMNDSQHNPTEEINLHNSGDLLEELYTEVVDDLHELEYSKKRKRSDDVNDNDVVEINPLQNKLVKFVDIDIIKKQSGNFMSNKSNESILLKQLEKCHTVINKPEVSIIPREKPPTETGTVEIKSEPVSDTETNENEDMDAKRHYLSALNISEKVPEKSKPQSKIDEASKIKLANNVNKVIDDVVKNNESYQDEENIFKKDKLKELSSKLNKNPLKQRARKSFPKHNVTIKQISSKKDISLNSYNSNNNIKTLTSKNASPTESQSTSNTASSNQTQSLNNVLPFLPPNQTIAYTTNIGSPILTMIPHSVAASFANFIVPTNLNSINSLPTLQPKLSTEKSQNDSLNNITKQTEPPALVNLNYSHNNKPQTSTNTTTTYSSSHSTTNTLLNGQTAIQNKQTTEVNDDYNFLNGHVPENITKAISDLMCRGPPKLKPRPPGPLSTTFDSGIPSSAGPVTTHINSISHRLTDYFRGMLIETLEEIGATNNLEALTASLKLENEKLKHKHTEEIMEIKKNVNTILRDLQKSMAEEREKIIEETRAICEAEAVKRVEEAKSKQWCANCMKEAQFYCCWNTSYCDYPCQSKHWLTHMPKCSQLQNDGTGTTNQVTPLILRKTAAPKTFPGKNLVGKSGKAVNKSSPSKAPVNVVKTTNTLTILEQTPGTYELVGNGPISVGAKILNFSKIKSGNIITVSSASSTNNSDIAAASSKKFVLAQAKSPVVSKPSVEMK